MKKEVRIGTIIFTGDAALKDLEEIFAGMIAKGYVMKTNDETVSNSIIFEIRKEVDE